MPPGHRMEEGQNQTQGRGVTDCIHATATSIVSCGILPPQQSLWHTIGGGAHILSRLSLS